MDAVDKQLFRISIVVTLGNGETMSFWQSSWLNGEAPMDLFPDLFKWAWRKNRTVKEELHEQNWTRGLWRMQTADEMASFVHLWDAVHEVQLTTEQDNTSLGVGWRMEFTAPNQHTTCSFRGAIAHSEVTQFGKLKLKKSTSFCLVIDAVQDLDSRQVIAQAMALQSNLFTLQR